MSDKNPAADQDQKEDILIGNDVMARVILFNDEWHTFDQVITQIAKATRCDFKKAEKLTWQVHSEGKSMVYEGEISKCLIVSHILESIDLGTQIEY